MKQGDKVKVNYTGTLNDGSVFDTSEGKQPLEFVIGSQMVIPGFENAIKELEVGEKTKAHLSVEEAYGQHNPQLIQEVPVSNIPQGAEIGAQLQGQTQDGQPFIAVVTEINESVAKVDLNHPLAGKELNFEIEVVDVISQESDSE